METIQDHIGEIKDAAGLQHFTVFKYDVGSITETDLIECIEFDMEIFCMDITPNASIESQAIGEGISVRTYDIIYKLLEDLKVMNDKIAVEKSITVDVKGSALVQQIFEINLNKSSNFFFVVKNWK
jgi:translation initiation factor IF-2